MIDRKTYLTLPGDYKTLKSDFLGALEASGKDVLVLTDCVTLKVGKTRFIISPLFAPIDPKRIVSKAFTKEEFTALMTEYHEGCTPEDIESLRFVPTLWSSLRRTAERFFPVLTPNISSLSSTRLRTPPMPAPAFR